jgi:histone H3/H4
VEKEYVEKICSAIPAIISKVCKEGIERILKELTAEFMSKACEACEKGDCNTCEKVDKENIDPDDFRDESRD